MCGERLEARVFAPWPQGATESFLPEGNADGLYVLVVPFVRGGRFGWARLECVCLPRIGGEKIFTHPLDWQRENGAIAMEMGRRKWSRRDQNDNAHTRQLEATAAKKQRQPSDDNSDKWPARAPIR